MNKKIFITGFPGCGKTTLIIKIAKEIKGKIKFDGFATKEIRKDGKRIGFELIDLKNFKSYPFASKEKIGKIRFRKYFLELKYLEDILDKMNSNILIIDEIGMMEMQSEKFRKFIKENLKSEKVLVATLHRKLIKKFKNYKIFWLNSLNFNRIYETIKRFLLDLNDY